MKKIQSKIQCRNIDKFEFNIDYLRENAEMLETLFSPMENLLDFGNSGLNVGMLRICLNHDGVAVVESHLREGYAIPLYEGNDLENVHYRLTGIMEEIKSAPSYEIINRVESLYENYKNDLDISIEIENY